jgi:hypothetical protein
MKRKTICSFLILAMVLAMLAGCAKATIPSLLFPKDNYTVETKTVTTSEGDKTVTYLFYEHITYVANPVDAKYQSMNVSVPVKIDGVDIDATNAPIFFDVNVGGYMSSIAGVGMAGPPPGMELPPGFKPAPDVSGLALAAGYVVVSPGCRGRDNQAADGTYYGKAPAAIVDLKCAVRYVRHNDDIMPGNAKWIIASGGSAGGALSALLGASGNSDLYDEYFEELGAADEDDNIYAAAPYCPITDLEHADMAYEWMFGTTPIPAGAMVPGAPAPSPGGLVDQTLSRQLKDAFTDYQASLNLKGKDDFGTITADNYADYLLQYYLVPSANKYLSALSATDRASYLEKNKWITWANNTASFTFADYVAHVGRLKGLPAFDDFEMTMAEPILFGNATTNARHFTNFSLRYTTGNSSAEIDNDLKTTVNLMNPMYFIGKKNRGCAKYWWIRLGTSDNHTSLTVSINLATSLENLNKKVNTWLYWDAGHGANEDPEDFIAWIGNITGYTK